MKIFMRIFCLILSICVLFTSVYANNAQIKTTAKSVILIEQSTKQVLYEQNADEKLPIASVTKVMTMLLCMEALQSGKIKMDDIVTASEHACSMGGSQIFLEPGEQMTVSDMIKAIAVASGNDAAVAMAEHIMGSEEGFVNAMNKRAKALGMVNTHFVNCNGLDVDEHYSSARDVAIVSAELLKHEKILPFLKIWMDSLRNGAFELSNTNKLIRFYPGAIGIKTGSTGKAKYCLSGAAKRDGLTLIAVVLAADTTVDRFETAKALLNYGFANYTVATPIKQGENIASISVKKGIENSVNIVTSTDFNKLITKGSNTKIERCVELPQTVNAPILKGNKAGEIILKDNGKEIGKVDLVFEKSIDKINIGFVFTQMLKCWGGQK